MTQEEHDRIFKMGQEVTTKIWKEFSESYATDPVMKKAAYEIMNTAWVSFRDRIDMIDSAEFWQSPVAHLGLFEIVRRQCVAYADIYEQLWKESFQKKYGERKQ